MALMPINNANFGFVNPVHNFAKIAVTMLVLNVISRLPVAEARDASALHETCEVICDPIAEGKDHPAERTCQEICKKGNVIVRITEWTQDKAGKILESKIMKAVAPALGAWTECAELCRGPQAIAKTAGVFVEFIPLEIVPGGGAAKEGIKVAAKVVPEIIDKGCVTTCCAAKAAKTVWNWVF